MLETAIEIILPYVIGLLEIMGIVVVAWSGITAFWEFIKDVVKHKRINFMFDFSQGLAAGLEFKMAAEILKTVLIREMSELLVLGAVILLRAVLSVLIHFEMKHSKDE
ncbi:MAG: DUF1622 domain-containing protein [Clostridia bacterium]|nr:DUF1622 domain-containing protein [Clostridia bacterium]